ncbi:amidophosphoribosyltransferase [Flavobacteriales bacterium 34_180_T64]|nr:amidophosphoribosyltransferase [Flavobacteriales bacterium 34_180_T64]
MVKNLLNLFFPKVCLGCTNYLIEHEALICTSCRHELPLTNYHFDGSDIVKNVLYGRVNLQEATALLHFSKKGIVQQLMHNLKYKGHEDIGKLFGIWLGEELNTIETYPKVDLVIPVPLHRSKLKRRGYNQVSKFGQEVAKALDVEYRNDILKKVVNTKTQVFKDRLKRSTEKDAVFIIDETQELKGKHILIVDDIITTGATIELCTHAFKNVEDLKFSLATMAITD